MHARVSSLARRGRDPCDAPPAAASPRPKRRPTAAAPEEKAVNVLNWSDYIADTTVADFEQKTGIKVTYDVFDSNEVLETKLLAGRSGYDIVVPTAPFLERQIKAGVFLPLDKSKLPNLKNMDPDIMQRVAAHDPGNQYSLTYLWGTIGLGYNPDMVKRRSAPTRSTAGRSCSSRRTRKSSPSAASRSSTRRPTSSVRSRSTRASTRTARSPRTSRSSRRR